MPVSKPLFSRAQTCLLAKVNHLSVWLSVYALSLRAFVLNDVAWLNKGLESRRAMLSRALA
jgi:hypothetical protein